MLRVVMLLCTQAPPNPFSRLTGRLEGVTLTACRRARRNGAEQTAPPARFGIVAKRRLQPPSSLTRLPFALRGRQI
jgi:hypothetical protein